uniref:Uncharacterized protein n=1 Tax=Lepeophtheirus salmonis TaxID=72036 RepID=A0A0K2U3H2_LEPSM
MGFYNRNTKNVFGAQGD